MYMCVCVYICICIHIYTYIYIYETLFKDCLLLCFLAISILKPRTMGNVDAVYINEDFYGCFFDFFFWQ
jgi:hypothetical protein